MSRFLRFMICFLFSWFASINWSYLFCYPLQEQRVKEMKSSPTSPQNQANAPPSSMGTNPFTGPPQSQPSLDLLGSPVGNAAPVSSTSPNSNMPSDDLLSLNTNPFQQTVQNAMNSTQNSYGGSPFGVTNGMSSNNIGKKKKKKLMLT